MNEKCQVFTPNESVNKLLDLVEYTDNLYGKKIVENSCGDGNILQEIVKRYIQTCLSAGMSREEIKRGLENDIFGSEIDPKQHEKCLSNLDGICSFYEIENVKWNIANQDALKEKPSMKFDYVVGNPPYISYREMSVVTRTFVRENFDSCKKGKFDYCYAFIEYSILSLNPNGKMAYLIPNSIFKNVFAARLRKLILPHLVRIVDYTSMNLFERALTSSAILVCEKDINATEIYYEDVKKKLERKISPDGLTDKWIFSSMGKNKKKRKFSDYFTASLSVATLYNKAFIIREYEENQEYVTVGDYRIERKLLRTGVSPRSLRYEKDEYIIFPYAYDNSGLVKYSKEEFEKNFPCGTEYLMSHKGKLAKRDSDQNAKWFEYGRSQALAHLNQEKLLLSTIITGKIKVYSLNAEAIPYSGIYLVSKGELPLSRAIEILESKAFLNYVKKIGINANGDSLRITAVDINEYMF